MPRPLIVLALGMPLPADAVCESEPDHGLFPPEPADQAQVPLVSLKDVGLAVEAWLCGCGTGPDPPAVTQADHLIRVLPAPHRLGCAPRKSAQLAGWPADHRVDRDLPDAEGPGLVTIEAGEGALESGGRDARGDGEPVDGHRPLPPAACDVSAESLGIQAVCVR